MTLRSEMVDGYKYQVFDEHNNALTISEVIYKYNELLKENRTLESERDALIFRLDGLDK